MKNIRRGSAKLNFVNTFLVLILVTLLGACTKSVVNRGSTPSVNSGTTLKYPIGVTASDGFWELIPAGKQLPTVYSETFNNQEDNQDSASIEISQKTEAGNEGIVSVDLPIPPKPEGTVNMLITLKVDESKMLRVKVSVMDSGLVKEYGPFPVE